MLNEGIVKPADVTFPSAFPYKECGCRNEHGCDNAIRYNKYCQTSSLETIVQIEKSLGFMACNLKMLRKSPGAIAQIFKHICTLEVLTE